MSDAPFRSDLPADGLSTLNRSLKVSFRLLQNLLDVFDKRSAGLVSETK